MDVAQVQMPLADMEPDSSGTTPPVTLSTNIFASPKEKLIQFILGFCAMLSVFTTLGIAGVLVYESVSFFRNVPLLEFLTGTQWTPEFVDRHYGIWPLLSGTLLITFIAAAVAVPIGLAAAIYIAEYAPQRVRKVLKPALELLAGVPTVVFGFFALTFVTPLLQQLIPTLGVYNALSAGIVVGVMIVPVVASLSEDAIRAVPRSMADAGYALGATKIEVVLRVMVPGALSGIIASFILGISRAIGETMVVTLAAGNMAQFTFNPLDQVRTMTAYIVQISMGDTPHGSIVYSAIFAVGLMLFVITLVMNMLANWIIRRFREQY